jgi:hypothetical protein
MATLVIECERGMLFDSVFEYSGTSVHERPCSRTIRFMNKFSEQKSLGLRTRKLATAAS